MLQFATSTQIQPIPANSGQCCNFNQSPQLSCNFDQSFTLSRTGFRVYIQAEQTCAIRARRTMPTKIWAKGCEKQYPGVLHASGGKSVCTWCNIVIEHKWKSSIDKHFATAKHKTRTAEMPAGHQTKQLTMTQAVASKSIANGERIRISYFKCTWLVLVSVLAYV